jgi:hypothetical protein
LGDHLVIHSLIVESEELDGSPLDVYICLLGLLHTEVHSYGHQKCLRNCHGASPPGIEDLVHLPQPQQVFSPILLFA